MERSAAGGRHGFPAALTSFAGRAGAVDEVAARAVGLGSLAKRFVRWE